MELQQNNWIGKKLGKYKILELLGCGGMGAVYKAKHTFLERIVCLKILFPSLAQHGKNALERFFQEAKAVCKIRSS